MEDSEKLTALKKAYADIILNTAKEAAARIMVSERKATRFQQELVSSKDEALRMLLRLKQMFDSKVSEAELVSLNQQKKIEELEAQLQEAEEIVRDLRAELRETQAELENVTKQQMHPPVEQNIEGEVAAQENFLQENRLNPCDGSIYSAPGLQFESVSISDTRNPTVNGSNDGSKLCGSHDHTNNCYIHNPDFASIVIRRKEPKLYRNGCTQRIHAFERSLFDGNMSVSGNLDNVQDETLASAHEEGKAMTVSTNGKADIICEKEKQDELKVVKEDVDLVKVPVVRKKRKFGKRKAFKSRLHSNHVKETHKESHLPCAKDFPYVLDNDDPLRASSSIAYGNEVQKDLMSPFADLPSDTTASNDQSGSHSNTENGEVFVKACSAQNKTKDDNEQLDKSDLTRQESLSTGSLEVPACKDVEASNGSLDKMDPKVSDLDEKVSNRFTNDKFLKYTFRRKRKKDSVSCNDVDCSQDNNSSKKKCGEKQDGHVEPHKSCTMTESSRDSRRLAQVARQLISLSEKKWWQ
ncbi:uncharacterized protein LOC109789024 isoform X2 [Cajanus cajan]|uniref:uncharacterized protein LOC109789024 isoform X1 n=1 Tax=Cajanus cajan TaxID=3821 RepID=UPI00098DAA17|nr:uncharacterized protein LOC109789024 isoform X1 [Cajanus cajan]XP_020203479.1 uncharacterized protein LOC109789024 isoform X2 [Cajanus cajan]